MEATTFLSLSSIPRLPQRQFSKKPSSRNNLINIKKLTINAKQADDKGNSIDDNMIVLKMRIKKLKVSESSNNSQEGAATPLSSDWKEWEKNLFTRYHEGVCDSMELLQSYLMNTRPSVALGMLALVAMSVPLSTSVVFVNALKVARGLLAGCHVCIDIDF